MYVIYNSIPHKLNHKLSIDFTINIQRILDLIYAVINLDKGNQVCLIVWEKLEYFASNSLSFFDEI